jgi:hypothetical protein
MQEDIAATKDQIRDIKRQDVSATMNALRLANQAEETGRDTLARLGAQGERIHKYAHYRDTSEDTTNTVPAPSATSTSPTSAVNKLPTKPKNYTVRPRLYIHTSNIN